MGKKEKKGGNKPATAASTISKCTASECKSDAQRFSFCMDHFDQYKFGLIKKNGERVPDYDKKFKHYQDYVEKRSALKVA